MFPKSPNIPGIQKIGFIDRNNISRLDIVLAFSGIPAEIKNSNIVWIDFAGIPQISTEESSDNNSPDGSSTLKFDSSDDIPTESSAFIFKDTKGRYWVIGADDIHFGSVDVKYSSSQPDADPAVAQFTVKCPFMPAACSLT